MILFIIYLVIAIMIAITGCIYAITDPFQVTEDIIFVIITAMLWPLVLLAVVFYFIWVLIVIAIEEVERKKK